MHWVRVKFCQGLLLISATKMSSYTGTEENFHHFMRLNISEINDDGIKELRSVKKESVSVNLIFLIV